MPSTSACESLENAISRWKRELPPEMSIEAVEEWSFRNVWILVLRATSYRFECVFYRSLKELYRASGDTRLMQRALQKQQNAMLELDTTLDRVMLHDLVRCCPLAVFVFPPSPQCHSCILPIISLLTCAFLLLLE